MSCIAGIVNRDGRPVAAALLEQMAGAMGAYAPDGIVNRAKGSMGLAHALLRTGQESANQQQPCTLDDNTWITGDVRLDGRQELAARLGGQGWRLRSDTPDLELILRAHQAFGETFLEYLIGDFAFALWDGEAQRLLCVRDHFGVRPLFYTVTPGAFIFASRIEALLLHPGVSRELDDTAIGDFLLVGTYLEEELTIYRQIRALPPASILTVAADGSISTRRYWRLSTQEPMAGRSLTSCLEEFQFLFRQAVTDRVRTDRLAVELSGGMDSTSIAAEAVADIRSRGGTATAFTSIAGDLLPQDREGELAGLVAGRLDIPIHYTSMADYQLFTPEREIQRSTAEPCGNPIKSAVYDTQRAVVATGARVILSGFQGDAVMGIDTTRLGAFARRGQLLTLIGECFRHLKIVGSPRGLGLRGYLCASGNEAEAQPLPDWLGRELVSRLQLGERWRLCWDLYKDGSPIAQLSRPWISQGMVRGIVSQPLEMRYPFLDLRLVHFLLALPNYLKLDKYLLRKAMAGRLPGRILRRPKEGQAGDLFRAMISRQGFEPEGANLSELISRGYVDMDKYLRAWRRVVAGEGRHSAFSSSFILQPLALESWLVEHQPGGVMDAVPPSTLPIRDRAMENNPKSKEPKKQYKPPKLIKYGRISELTQAATGCNITDAVPGCVWSPPHQNRLRR